MTNKCLFTKSTENVNTSVIVNTELGPITVHICDDELGKTLAEVSKATTDLIEQARTLADTFGFNLEEAIAKGGMMTVGAPEPAPVAAPAPAPAAPKPSSSPQTMRMQEIPSRIAEAPEMPEEAPEEAPEAAPEPVAAAAVPEMTMQEIPGKSDAPVNEGVAPGEKVESKVRVQTPHGRQFELPDRVVDETGETSIVIDTESEKAFNEKLERDKKDHEQGKLTAYQDGYTTRFMPCKLCIDPKTKQPTGKVSGQVCPKCKGSGEIIVR